MKNDKLYIQMFSIHGLLRGKNLELGRDADTGGQVLYVTELAKHMSQLENVERIDLFTRLISDKTTSDDYAVPIEEVTEKFRIIRIRCGGFKYIRKELLWPHLDEYVDKTIKFIKRQNRIPDIFHGHYQRKFKISYYMEPSKDHLTEIHDRLVRNKCRYNLVYSGDKYLDIIPYRSSKGKAIRYISYKWEIPIDHIVTSGDSGNDEEMLKGDLLGIVVGNYEKEMEPLKGLRKIYFAKNEYASGIIEGLEHYGLLREAKQQRRKKS